MQYWHNGQRRRESTKCEKPKAAQDILRKKLSELDRLSSPPTVAPGTLLSVTSSCAASSSATPRVLVRHLYASLERDYEINQRKSLKILKIRWRLRLEKAFGNLPVASVTIEEISAYIAERVKAKAANGTINRDLATLKRCYTLAIETGILKFGERPFFPTLEERNVRKGFVKDEQYAKLATSTGEIGLWLRALFEVGYTYGWRKEELLSRRVRHADLFERTLNLDPGETKNEEPRTAHMTKRVFELLKQCASGKSPEDYLFTRETDSLGRKAKTPYIVDFRKSWEKATIAAGCPGLLFHDLRRTGVSNMIRDGISEKQAMSVSGHRTRSVFDRYHIVDPAQGQEIARKMERGSINRIREARQSELFTQGDGFEAVDSLPARKPVVPERSLAPEARVSAARKPS